MIRYTLTTADGKLWPPESFKYIGYVRTPSLDHIQHIRRTIPVIGKFPVFIRRSGDRETFTHPHRVTIIEEFDDGVFAVPLGVM